MIGVDYDFFWTLNPKSLTPFIKAFDLKKKYDDEVAWTHGIYVQRAVASVLSKEVKYPNKPLMSCTSIKHELSAEEIKEKMLIKMKIINSRFGKEN